MTDTTRRTRRRPGCGPARAAADVDQRSRLRCRAVLRPDQHPVRHRHLEHAGVLAAQPVPLRVRPADRPGRVVRVQRVRAPVRRSPDGREVRPAISWYDFVSGSRVVEFAARVGGRDRRVAGPGQRPRRRSARSDRRRSADTARRPPPRRTTRRQPGADDQDRPDELAVIRQAVQACESGLDTMRERCGPGVTEQELWAHLHHTNIASGGEWLETRLLTSGQRTNPWYQECSDKVIEDGDLVAFDTDLIGIGGYSVDISRTWLAGDGHRHPTSGDLQDAAFEQLQQQRRSAATGCIVRSRSRTPPHLPPADIHSVTNAAVAHGIGLCNEYPLILNRDHFSTVATTARSKTGMVLCVGGARRTRRRRRVREARGAGRDHGHRPRTSDHVLTRPLKRCTRCAWHISYIAIR